MWDSSSRPSCARAATAPWTWGWSSWPPPLVSGMGLLLLAAAPGLGCGVAPPSRHPQPQTWVAPLGHSCAVTVWHSQPLPLTSYQWGNSSWLPPFGHGVLLASAPDPGCEAAPLGCALVGSCLKLAEGRSSVSSVLDTTCRSPTPATRDST